MDKKMEIIAEAGKQELFVIREFDAPRELVFRAWTEPELLKRYFAPHDYTMHFHHHDYRTGGSYSWYHTDSEGRTLCTFNGSIHEIHAPERVIQTAEFMELPVRGQVVMEALLFEELPGNRTRLTIHDVFFSVESRDGMVNSGFEGGLAAIFDNLDHLLPNL